MYKLQKKIKIFWSANFAYGIGLMASDGFLNKDGRHLGFVSKETEMIKNFKISFLLKNKITKSARGGEKIKKYSYIYFGDKNFYDFLNSIGITKAKSKTIKSVRIPKKYFADFLRGLHDGDGSFYTFWDTRWPNSFGYKITFASASLTFLKWLKTKLFLLYKVKGTFHKGRGVYEIRYPKGDSLKIFEKMHYKNRVLFLKRKYDKIQKAFKFDKKNKIQSRTSSSVRALP